MAIQRRMIHMETSYTPPPSNVKLEAVERLRKYSTEPIVKWDGKVLQCEDPAIARLIRIYSNGDADLIGRIVGQANTRQALLRDHEGWIRLSLLAAYLEESLSEKVKDPSKRLLEMIREYAPTPHNRGKRTKASEEPESQASAKAVGNLLGMAKKGQTRRKT
jgi:hypothetical protein